MQKIKSLLKIAYSQQLPIRQRFFSIIFTLGFLVGIAGVLACIYLDSSEQAIMVSLVGTLALPVFAYVGISANAHQDAVITVALFILNFFTFPALFITGGAINCGLPSFFCLGIALTLFLVKGKASYILAGAECLWYFFIYFACWKWPQIALDVPAFLESETGIRDFTFESVFSNSVIVCLGLGLIAKVIFNLYRNEHNIVQETIKEVERQSIIDPLTAIYNRRYMYSYLSNELTKAKESGDKLSVVLFDIDHFKELNDTYGHLLGDSVLKSIASIIKASCTNEEMVARYGGEEFLLILPGYSKEDAFKRAEEIRLCIEQSHLSPELPEDEPVTISGGVCEYKVGMADEDLVEKADKRLYMAKDLGRNQIIGEEAAHG